MTGRSVSGHIVTTNGAFFIPNWPLADKNNLEPSQGCNPRGQIMILKKDSDKALELAHNIDDSYWNCRQHYMRIRRTL